MPSFIAYGVGNSLHLPLMVGMEVILIPSFNPNEFADLLNKYHPDHMVGVPSHYGNIIHNKKIQSQDLSYIITPTVGDDAMDISLEKKRMTFWQSIIVLIPLVRDMVCQKLQQVYQFARHTM